MVLMQTEIHKQLVQTPVRMAGRLPGRALRAHKQKLSLINKSSKINFIKNPGHNPGFLFLKKTENKLYMNNHFKQAKALNREAQPKSSLSESILSLHLQNWPKRCFPFSWPQW